MKKTLFLFLLVFPLTHFAQSLEWLSPVQIDWGKIREGETITGRIEFKNNSTSTIHILNVRSHCGCTVADIDKTEYKPGEKGAISYTLRTKNYHGLIRKSITIKWKDKTEHTERFVLQADIKREFDVSPNYFSFYNTPWQPDTVITGLLVMTNRSKQTIQVEKVYSKNGVVTIDFNQFKLPPDDSHAVQFSIQPTSPESKTDYIFVETDFQNRKQSRIPVFLHFKQ